MGSHHRPATVLRCCNAGSANDRAATQVLVALQRLSPHGLLFTTIEDANMGMWLAGMSVQRINWPGIMLAAGWTCCFARTSQCALALRAMPV